MKNIDDFTCGRVIELRDLEYTIREIATKLYLPKSTVHNIIKRYYITGSCDRYKPSGAPKALNHINKCILFELKKDAPKSSAPGLNRIFFEKTGVVVSDQTIRRELKSEGFIACSAVYRPLLSNKNILTRYNICKKWNYKPDSYWDDIIWSDECKFNMNNSDGPPIIWRKSGERQNPIYTNKIVKYGGGHVIVWGCMSSHGVGKLVFIEGTMNSQQYTNIIANNIRPSAQLMGLDTFIFQQDNDPKHTSRHTSQFFLEENIQLLEWPSQSPDLNPIEHLWAWMKQNMRGKKYTKPRVLKDDLEQLWSTITPLMTYNLVKSMPKRVLEVLKNNGGNTSY